MQRKVTCLWKEPNVAKTYQSAVSLHGHTNHSRESLHFILDFATRHPLLRHALAAQELRARRESGVVVDFWKGYWTPPLPPLPAFQLERGQIETMLGLPAMVSLTDHDNIEAPMLLRVVPEARRIPVSVEWTVPFMDAIFHLGVHNLPSGRAEFIMQELDAYTRDPEKKNLPELLRLLNENHDVLVVLNHPLWDLARIGRPRHLQILSKFAADLGMFIHAFEISGIRSWEENQLVLQLAEGWDQLAISDGDRHGSEPNAVLNLTEAESFAEFVHQVREDRRSHVLFMPQYTEPVSLRVIQQLLDVIREYPDYPTGARRWDERVFHPDQNGIVRPLASLWQKPPGFIELIFSAFRLVEVTPVRRAIQFALTKPEAEIRFAFGDRQGVVS